jgi:hypothetical protein
MVTGTLRDVKGLWDNGIVMGLECVIVMWRT